MSVESRSVTTGWVAKTVLLTRVLATSMRNLVGAPVTARMVCESTPDKVAAVKVKVLVPAGAVRPRFWKVATPPTASTLKPPVSVPFGVTDAVTSSVELATRFPEMSRISATGWVPNALPFRAVAASVTSSTWFAAP